MPSAISMKKRLLILTLLFPALAFGQSPATAAKTPKDTVRKYKIPDLDIDMIFVQGGSFIMGQDNLTERMPAHKVSVNSYYISQCKITQAQWQIVMGYNESLFKGCDKCPVENVSWNAAQEFIKKLSRSTGAKYRLPTEAEWEYAAKGGAKSAHYKYSGSDMAGDVAWYLPNGDGKTHPVGSKKPNELGLYDMSGNLQEWCNDWYDKNYYSRSPTNNPLGPATGELKVVRGNDYQGTMEELEPASRSHEGQYPDLRDNLTGFRIVRNYP